MNKFLQELQTFNLSPDKIENIISKGKLLHVKNQSLLISPNMVCDKVYFVLKGGFVCRYIDEELEINKTINFYLEDFHPYMSCVDSYFSNTKTQCELRAIANSEVIEFNKDDIDSIIKDDIDVFTYFHTLWIFRSKLNTRFQFKVYR